MKKYRYFTYNQIIYMHNMWVYLYFYSPALTSADTMRTIIMLLSYGSAWKTPSGTHLCRIAWQIILWVPVIVALKCEWSFQLFLQEHGEQLIMTRNQTHHPCFLRRNFFPPLKPVWTFPYKRVRTRSGRVLLRNLLDGTCFFPLLLKRSKWSLGGASMQLKTFKLFIDS